MEPKLREYKSRSEIEQDPAYMPEAPVTLEAYDRLEGWYQWPKEEIRCCVQKSNGLCRKEHKWGWVVVLKDGTKSVIGNVCANNPDFGAQTVIGRAITRAQNSIDAARVKADVSAYLADRDGRIAALEAALERAQSAHRRVQDFLHAAGPTNEKAIKECARTGQPFRALGITPAKYKYDEDGRRERVTDERRVTVNVGTLPGMAAANPAHVAALGRDIHGLLQKLRSSSIDEMESNPRLLRRLRAQLGDHDRVVALADAYAAQADEFLSADLAPACYAALESTARKKMAELALKRAGKTELAPGTYLGNMDEGLKRQYNVQTIQGGA
jgi:hypothetical protein